MATLDPKKLEAAALADVERAHGLPSSGATTPETGSDQREELKTRIVAAARAAGSNGAIDVDLAIEVNEDHAPWINIRPLLAELAIGGCVVCEATDGERWLVRLAPEGMPSLEERVLSVLAEAGIGGTPAGFAIVRKIEADLRSSLPCEVMAFFNRDALYEPFGPLLRRGVVRAAGGRYTLSPAEWARRIADDLIAKGLVDSDKLFTHVRDRVEDMLSGAPSERPTVTPAQPTLRTGDAPAAQEAE